MCGAAPRPGMKEDKENARPKERRGAPVGPGAGSGAAGGSDGRTGGGAAELERLERPKDKKETLSKVRPGPSGAWRGGGGGWGRLGERLEGEWGEEEKEKEEGGPRRLL